jgi:hypothetical protein
MHHDSVGPDVMERTVVGAQSLQNCRRAACSCGNNVAAGDCLIFECNRVLDGGKASSGLPAYGFEPLLEDIEEGPTGEHPLIGGDPGKFVP